VDAIVRDKSRPYHSSFEPRLEKTPQDDPKLLPVFGSSSFAFCFCFIPHQGPCRWQWSDSVRPFNPTDMLFCLPSRLVHRHLHCHLRAIQQEVQLLVFFNPVQLCDRIGGAERPRSYSQLDYRPQLQPRHMSYHICYIKFGLWYVIYLRHTWYIRNGYKGDLSWNTYDKYGLVIICDVWYMVFMHDIESDIRYIMHHVCKITLVENSYILKAGVPGLCGQFWIFCREIVWQWCGNYRSVYQNTEVLSTKRSWKVLQKNLWLTCP